MWKSILLQSFYEKLKKNGMSTKLKCVILNAWANEIIIDYGSF